MAVLNFGDEVQVVEDAASEFRPGHRAWIVGLPTTDRNLLSIEFEDGSSIEVPPEIVRRQT
jgi:hypothetical protein